ncbi:hypothetical protein BpHYR1_040801 [Brachionus plicatilis]|uniref:Uncharacterized protein n=1 Tax=Brachionus plicatilis TaxID=10195 RepID=A0A3M7RJU3_BRAPC|nr:hypothetical protein BpHYR1_040801 [Brachionus plicatilis]
MSSFHTTDVNLDQARPFPSVGTLGAQVRQECRGTIRISESLSDVSLDENLFQVASKKSDPSNLSDHYSIHCEITIDNGVTEDVLDLIKLKNDDVVLIPRQAKNLVQHQSLGNKIC